MAKPVDARDLKSLGLRPVRVRVPPRVLHALGRTILLVIATSLVPVATAAQHRPAAFETIGISVSVLANVNRNSFHDIWQPGTGAELRLSAPFYAGTVEAGVDQLSFESEAVAVPGFRSRFIFIGWGLHVVRQAPIRWSAGARLGTYTMHFDDNTLPDYRRSENELGTELTTQVGWRFTPAWEAAISGRFRTVLTEPRIRHLNVAVTLTRDLRTPRWLRDFLN